MEIEEIEEPCFYILPENVNTFTLFLDICSGGEVWKYDSVGNVLGLDYQQVIGIITLRCLVVSADQAEDIQSMGREVAKVLRKS